MAKRNIGTIVKAKGKPFLIGLVAGCIVGALVLFGAMTYNPPDDERPSPTVLLAQISKINELATASQSYTIVDRVADSSRFFDMFDIPFTESSYILVYGGELKAGVDLDKANVEVAGNTVTVTLPQAQILSNTIAEDSFEVLDEQNNILNPISVADVTGFINQSSKDAKQAALEGDLLQEAQENAQDSIANLLSALVPEDYTIEFITMTDGEQSDESSQEQ